MTKQDLDQLAINTIRTLSIDAVQQAKSGHPGTPMALAPLVYTLWNRVMRFDPQGPDLAQSRPLRPVQRPRLDAAVVGPVPDGHAGGERGVRAAGRAIGHARRHPPFPPARQQGAGASGISLGLGRRDDDRPAGSGDCHQRRHGDRAQVAGQPVQQAGLRGVRLQHLRHLRRRLPDGGRRLGGRLARRPPRASTTCAGSTTTTTSPSRARRASPSPRMWRRASGPTAGTCCTSAMPTICARSRMRSRPSARRRAGRR